MVPTFLHLGLLDNDLSSLLLRYCLLPAAHNAFFVVVSSACQLATYLVYEKMRVVERLLYGRNAAALISLGIVSARECTREVGYRVTLPSTQCGPQTDRQTTSNMFSQDLPIRPRAKPKCSSRRVTFANSARISQQEQVQVTHAYLVGGVRMAGGGERETVGGCGRVWTSAGGGRQTIIGSGKT